MLELIAVTNRKLCSRNFLEQIEIIANTDVSSIILREKDLPQSEYEKLAADVISICKNARKKCVLHYFADTALKLNHPYIHLPLDVLKHTDIRNFETVGCSVHTEEQLLIAEKYGATYAVAGHIFATKCKDGVPPKGVDFLRNMVLKSNIPLYAIGGINTENIDLIKASNANGACLMSYYMNFY